VNKPDVLFSHKEMMHSSDSRWCRNQVPKQGAITRHNCIKRELLFDSLSCPLSKPSARFWGDVEEFRKLVRQRRRVGFRDQAASVADKEGRIADIG
jgi:hypothetical protein